MRILFLTLIEINSIQERGIYQDLLRKFVDEGHNVTIVAPLERRKKTATNLKISENVTILQVKTFNVQKTNILEKGIGTLAIEYQYLNAIKKYLGDSKFDLVLYSTPPITFFKVIDFIKKRDDAFSYLLLKDIFPQNAVDMKMIKKGGLLHKIFRRKERKLYAISDAIGCMSKANADFVLKHNPEISSVKVEVNPNSIEPKFIDHPEGKKNEIKIKYALPLDKKIFVYGGNLGKPQGLDFLLDSISEIKIPEAFFLIVGNGTEFNKIKQWFLTNNPKNAALIKSLPKDDYDCLLAACDVGMVFLHRDFTIPNFPSRLLSYLEMKLPILVASDAATDIGTEVEKNNCGIKVEAGDIKAMKEAITEFCEMEESDFRLLKNNARCYLENEFLVEYSFQKIVNKREKRNRK
jgi:glycosyltransferase involved in cell wall biosynthesis